MTFWARTGTRTGGDGAAAAPYRLSGTEFVRRWSLHILPKSFVKTRRFGGYSNHHCERYLAACRGLLQAAGIQPVTVGRPLDRQESAEPDEATSAEATSSEATTPCCAGCGAVLVCIAVDARRRQKLPCGFVKNSLSGVQRGEVAGPPESGFLRGIGALE